MKIENRIFQTEREINRTWNPITYNFFVMRWYYLQIYKWMNRKLPTPKLKRRQEMK